MVLCIEAGIKYVYKEGGKKNLLEKLLVPVCCCSLLPARVWCCAVSGEHPGRCVLVGLDDEGGKALEVSRGKCC